VGIAGRFLLRSGPRRRGQAGGARAGGGPGVPASDGPGVPVGVVFLEWADCRWWHWRAVLGADGRPLEGGETLWRAVDGDALPTGVGRWWSLGRLSGNVVQYAAPDADDLDDRPSPVVH
jgi:hypothetical protein